jgi:hypothetical protein
MIEMQFGEFPGNENSATKKIGERDFFMIWEFFLLPIFLFTLF